MDYNLFGWKWGSADAGSESGVIYWTGGVTTEDIVTDSRYDDADLEAALNDAFQTWEDVTGLDFEFTTNTSLADITVGAATYGGSKVGEASWSNFGRSGDYDGVSYAEIRFDTLDADAGQEWATYGVGGIDFYAVALHEIGHAVGLGHVSNSSEIMNGFISAKTLGEGDILGGQTLYGDGTVSDSDPDPQPASEPDPIPDPEPDPVTNEPGGNIFAKLFGILENLITSLFGGGASAASVVERLIDDFGGPETTVHDHIDHEQAEDFDLEIGETASFTHAVYVDDFLPLIDVPDCGCGTGCGCPLHDDQPEEDDALVFV